MTIFGAILAENEWKMTDFSLKTKTLVMWVQFWVHFRVHEGFGESK